MHRFDGAILMAYGKSNRTQIGATELFKDYHELPLEYQRRYENGLTRTKIMFAFFDDDFILHQDAEPMVKKVLEKKIMLHFYSKIYFDVILLYTFRDLFNLGLFS